MSGHLVVNVVVMISIVNCLLNLLSIQFNICYLANISYRINCIINCMKETSTELFLLK